LATPDLDGITLSGGEPFAQAGALAELLQRIRKQQDFGVMAYSGYRLGQLQGKAKTDSGIARLLNGIDLLIDGRFVSHLNDGAALRGSSNQQVYAMSDRYKADDLATSRDVEIHILEAGSMIVGVPGAAQLKMWQQYSPASLLSDQENIMSSNAVSAGKEYE